MTDANRHSEASAHPPPVSLSEQAGAQDWQQLVNHYAPLIYCWCRQAGLSVAEALEVGQEVFRDFAQKGGDPPGAAPEIFQWFWHLTCSRLGGDTRSYSTAEAGELQQSYVQEAECRRLAGWAGAGRRRGPTPPQILSVNNPAGQGIGKISANGTAVYGSNPSAYVYGRVYQPGDTIPPANQPPLMDPLLGTAILSGGNQWAFAGGNQLGGASCSLANYPVNILVVWAYFNGHGFEQDQCLFQGRCSN